MAGAGILGVPLSIGSEGYNPDNTGRPRSRNSRLSQGSVKTPPLEDQYLTDDPRFQYGPKNKKKSWHARPRSPGLEWHKHYNEQSAKEGRVLVIDYVKQDATKEGTRKVAAQEINNIHGLRRLYDNPVRGTEPILRLFHVQNASWAVEFLLAKLFIKADDLVGSNFGRYASYKTPERRGGKPLLRGKTWLTQHDPWRGIIKTAFGVDYLKPYRAQTPKSRVKADTTGKMMELNCYDDETDNPVYGFDVYAQRLSCYVQHKESVADIPTDPEIRNPYQTRNGEKKPKGYVPDLKTLDNGNVIILFENSKSCSIEDTAIPARRKWESRWRRLPFYLAYESFDVTDDDQMALQCTKLILQDIWHALASNWEDFLDIANHHIGILEDKIYEFPADESRADEIWRNSNNWLKTERTMFVHTDILKEVQVNLKEMAEDPSANDSPWLESNTAELQRLSTRIQEDLVKPTASLSDLMYKSVEIRDSRHSLELSYSMWRLSWITFIFLPLTFTVGFFGMNVDTFSGDPSVKWFFITAAPLMVIVFLSWYILKHQIAGSRQTPYTRGIYERMFHDLATAYPLLWSRGGPRKYVVPRNKWQRFHWSLIRRWNEPERTIRNAADAESNGQLDGLGTVARLKRDLTKRWTAEIDKTAALRVDPGRYEEGAGEAVKEGLEEVNELLRVPAVTGVRHRNADSLMVPADLNRRLQMAAEINRGAMESPTRPSSAESSGGRNSGIMVEEQKADWLHHVDE